MYSFREDSETIYLYTSTLGCGESKKLQWKLGDIYSTHPLQLALVQYNRTTNYLMGRTLYVSLGMGSEQTIKKSNLTELICDMGR